MISERYENRIVIVESDRDIGERITICPDTENIDNVDISRWLEHWTNDCTVFTHATISIVDNKITIEGITRKTGIHFPIYLEDNVPYEELVEKYHIPISEKEEKEWGFFKKKKGTFVRKGQYIKREASTERKKISYYNTKIRVIDNDIQN